MNLEKLALFSYKIPNVIKYVKFFFASWNTKKEGCKTFLLNSVNYAATFSVTFLSSQISTRVEQKNILE